MKYNEEVAYNLGLSLEDIYVLEKIEDNIRDTVLSKDGNNGEFSFNQVDLFKMCKFVFKQVNKNDSEDTIRKIYKTNNAKFNKMLKGSLGKVLIKGENIKKQSKSESYFKINKEIRTILINGYPKVVDLELNDIEKLVVDELKMKTIGKNIRTQLKSMDIDKLKVAIGIAKEHEILDYPYVKSIYNNLDSNVKKPQESPNSQGSNENVNFQNSDTNIVPQNSNNTSKNSKQFVPTVKTRYHNINQTFTNYEPDELEKLLQESQKGKFTCDDPSDTKFNYDDCPF
ncbi:Uncharacterised protein [uncultured Clostridium sp.]|nr:Uncharacterised protein [uncultured Clostridium sp.]